MAKCKLDESMHDCTANHRLRREAIQACYVPANYSLGSNAITACNGVKTLPIKEPAEAQKDEEGEGRDFSGSIAKSYW